MEKTILYQPPRERSPKVWFGPAVWFQLPPKSKTGPWWASLQEPPPVWFGIKLLHVRERVDQPSAHLTPLLVIWACSIGSSGLPAYHMSFFAQKTTPCCSTQSSCNSLLPSADLLFCRVYMVLLGHTSAREPREHPPFFTLSSEMQVKSSVELAAGFWRSTVSTTVNKWVSPPTTVLLVQAVWPPWCFDQGPRLFIACLYSCLSVGGPGPPCQLGWNRTAASRFRWCGCLAVCGFFDPARQSNWDLWVSSCFGSGGVFCKKSTTQNTQSVSSCKFISEAFPKSGRPAF